MAWTRGATVQGTYKAAADLSTKQYYFVKFTAADTVNVCSAVTDIPCGILLNKPDAANKRASVLHLGVGKVNADEAITIGALIASGADGQANLAVAGTDTTVYIAGQCGEAAGSAGDVVTAMINCMNPARAK